jgi:exonuclease SbcC
MPMANAPTSIAGMQSSEPLHAAPRERGLDGLAGALLGGWLTACMALQLPEATGLALVATLGLALSRLARVWGLGLAVGMLAWLLMGHPDWLRQDLMTRGALLLGLLNIWMIVALRSTASKPDVAGPVVAAPSPVGLQDVERSLMPHSAQVKRDLDQAQVQLAQQRERVQQMERSVLEMEQRAAEQLARVTTLEQQNQVLQAALLSAQEGERALQEELAPVRLEAGELREVLARTMARTQSLEEQALLLDELKQSLQQAQQSALEQQQSLQMQGGQLQEALQNLLREQQQRIELEQLITGAQGREQHLCSDLETTREDLERQQRVADHLLAKCAQLEAQLELSEAHAAQSAKSAQALQLVLLQQAAQVMDWLSAQHELTAAARCADSQDLQSMSERLNAAEQRAHALEQRAAALLEEQQGLQGRAQDAERAHADLTSAYQQVLQECNATKEQMLVQAEQLRAAVQEHERAAEAWQQRCAELEQQVVPAGTDPQQLQELRDALLSAQALAAHAQNRLEMQIEETQRLREQLFDPQRLESLKRASMLERQMALKEQVIARLQAQSHEVPDLIKIKHQHLQLRAQFDEHRQAAEALVAENHALEAQVLLLQERVQTPEPLSQEQTLLEQIRATEEECLAWEQEARLTAAALQRLLASQG